MSTDTYTILALALGVVVFLWKTQDNMRKEIKDDHRRLGEKLDTTNEKMASMDSRMSRIEGVIKGWLAPKPAPPGNPA